MARMTIKGRIGRYMAEGLGFKPIKSRAGRDGFTDPSSGKNYWLGKNGGVRMGRVPTRSMSVSDAFFVRMSEWEKRRIVDSKGVRVKVGSHVKYVGVNEGLSGEVVELVTDPRLKPLRCTADDGSGEFYAHANLVEVTDA